MKNFTDLQVTIKQHTPSVPEITEEAIIEAEEWVLGFDFKVDNSSTEGRAIQDDLKTKFKKIYSGSGSGGSGFDVSFQGPKKEIDKAKKYVESKYKKNLNPKFTNLYLDEGFEVREIESVETTTFELDEGQRWADKVSIPASKEITKHIESGKAKILINVPSTLHDRARFVVIQNPEYRNSRVSGQDKVLMATISDPKGGRIKMFAFHGSHVSHQKAMDFAKNHKLVAMKDAKGYSLYAKESVELDEGKMSELHMHIEDGKTAQQIAKIMKIDVNTIKELMKDFQESVEHLDEGLVLASDDLNAVKKTAQKLAKQSPDLTYYVVKHKTRFMKGMKYAYYEVYQSVDIHLIKGKATKVVGYGAKVDMRESVELDEVLSDREMERFTKAHTALHTKMHKQALQIIKFIDSVEKHKDKWTDSFGEYVTPKLSKELRLSNPNSVEYQQGRGRGDWSFLIQHGNVRYNNRDMPWMPKSGELPFDKFMKLLDTWKKNANKPKSTGSHMGRQTESVEVEEATKWKMGDGRPRGGSHIENIRFWDLSKDELEYIIKDAGKAMKANPKARKATTGPGNWADQVNDAHTVLGWRKKNNIKESVELDEGKAWKDIVKIQQDHTAKKIHGMLVDAQTARLLVQIHNALNAKNKKSFIDTIDKGEKGLALMVDFAWKQTK
jgi:hypothetical protein